MRKPGAMIAILSIGVLAALGWVSAQGSGPMLTGEDYGEIMQLYGRCTTRPMISVTLSCTCRPLPTMPFLGRWRR